MESSSSQDTLILPLCAIFRRFLKRKGLKFTPERAQILDSVLSKDGVFGAEQLLDEMREHGHRVSKATIYRTLKHLVEAKIVSEVLIDPKQSHYELTFGRKPKGHLVCMESNRVIEFPADDLQALAEKVCEKHGWSPLSFRFVVYGTCPEADTDDEDQA